MSDETLPVPGNMKRGFEVLRVFEDLENGFEVRVEVADVMDEPHSWGVFLSEVARALLPLFAHRTGESAFAEIERGFTANSGFLRFPDETMELVTRCRKARK
jgi:hypothetical protein